MPDGGGEHEGGAAAERAAMEVVAEMLAGSPNAHATLAAAEREVARMLADTPTGTESGRTLSALLRAVRRARTGGPPGAVRRP